MNPIASTILLNMIESETFDFKDGQYKFYGTASDNEKAELLKDVIAFANAWKTGDAFIVIGVLEKNGRKDKVTGVKTFLQDNDIQQFVNCKTNRRVKFLVYSDKADGQDINVIQIAQYQQRPIVLTKAYGGLEPNKAYVRSGSSTAIASPDQVAEWVKADHQISLAQVNLDLEWADSSNHQRLGKEVTIECLNLVEPPPPLPPKFSAAEVAALSEGLKELRGLVSTVNLGSIIKSVEAKNVIPTVPDLTIHNGPSDEDIREYAKARARFAPLRIWVKNFGLLNATSINVRIHIPKNNDVEIVDDSDLPRKPKGPFSSLFDSHINLPSSTYVEESSDGWQIKIHVRAIQPQDEFWSDCFFVSAKSDQIMEAPATIFADDSKPIEVFLKIHAKALTREITLDDLNWE